MHPGFSSINLIPPCIAPRHSAYGAPPVYVSAERPRWPPSSAQIIIAVARPLTTTARHLILIPVQGLNVQVGADRLEQLLRVVLEKILHFVVGRRHLPVVFVAINRQPGSGMHFAIGGSGSGFFRLVAEKAAAAMLETADGGEDGEGEKEEGGDGGDHRHRGNIFIRQAPSWNCEYSKSMDQITIKTPNPKCRLYWCLIEFIGWRYSQLSWYF
jgi:hypothetical protein